MNAKPILLLLVASVIAIISGCSNNSKNPVSPSDTSFEEYSHSQFMGSWTAEFNFLSNSVDLKPNRDLSGHMLLTPYLPAPEIVINEVDTIDQTVDVDVTISNPYTVTGYDLRLIIYFDKAGHKLLNFDGWTDHYDIDGGVIINPFMAYAKDDSRRCFYGMTENTENLIIKLPGMNRTVKLAIEACTSSNCKEPYMITNFAQGVLFDNPGSSTEIEIEVYDWNDDTNRVIMYCPTIITGSTMEFSQVDTNLWSGTLTNGNDAGAGTHFGYIIAYSDDSFYSVAYQEVEITLSPS